ncbi:MAG: NAD(P)H-dependent oxidoreductase [Bacteroidota bacterium]|nr:NAD(P)H-dependent oxidoreductase [Bacteroidota bacterium]
MELINALNWRYAVKRMNGQKVPNEKIQTILEATSLSASSMGLQPYKIFVIENETLREKLLPAVFNQPQIMEASHVLVFAAYKDVTEKDVSAYLDRIADVRNVSLESLEGFKDSLLSIVYNRTKEQKHQWAARQAYIAFGTAITAAAIEAVDATPMEGFNPAQVDEILHLDKQGLTSVTILALGYRDTANDKLAAAKKDRKEKRELIEELV